MDKMEDYFLMFSENLNIFPKAGLNLDLTYMRWNDLTLDLFSDDDGDDDLETGDGDDLENGDDK